MAALSRPTGDGMLVEFSSVVDAVRCAVEIQRAMVDRNAEVPEDKRITFCVGINVGDVIADGDDIYGDGNCLGCQSSFCPLQTYRTTRTTNISPTASPTI